MNATTSKTPLELKRSMFDAELDRILAYWADTAYDEAGACFYPKVDHTNRPDRSAVSGSVMYARILWAFSAGYRKTANRRYLNRADAAFQYIRRHFIDPEHGSVYWSVHPDGSPADTRKQIYAIAFTIYGLAEYHAINRSSAAQALAKNLYRTIEKYSWDPQFGGYIEAFARDWSPIADLRLSAKDNNEKKTLNTHLHILEAYTQLYKLWPNKNLKHRIVSLLGLFEKHFANQHGHLTLFFDEQWQARSSLRSFGHEIETSWLLCEASRAIGNGRVADNIRTRALQMAASSLKWVDASGALLYEFDASTNTLVAEKHWWVQAEAVVGFYRAGLLANDSRYFVAATRVWQYINDYLIDHQHGEWYWGRDEDDRIMDQQDKAGFWKCPYHNSRCCIQLIDLLS